MRCRFVAALDVDKADARFSIIQTEQMAYLTHISVNIRAGNDAAIKKYLATKVQHLKVPHHSCPPGGYMHRARFDSMQGENERLEGELLDCVERCKLMEAQASTTISDLERERDTALEEKHSGAENFSKKEADITIAFSQEKERMRDQFESQKKELERRMEQTVRDLMCTY